MATGYSDDILYGIHALKEALMAGTPIEKIFLKSGISQDIKSEILEKAKEKDIPFQFVPSEKIEKLCPRGANHQGVAAYVSLISYTDPEDMVSAAFEKGEEPLIIVLDEVSDVRNFGAIARTAECLGVHGIVIPQQGAARINADAIKISSGALNHISVARVSNLADTILLLKECGLQVISCLEKAQQNHFDCDFRKPTCIIMGSEDGGISKKLLGLSDEIVKIPMKGNVSSLNVSVASGIILMEALRQRGF